MGEDIQKPNIILLGVHHSGTTPITAMIHKMGWKYTETDKDYRKRHSYKWVVDLNREMIKLQRKYGDKLDAGISARYTLFKEEACKNLIKQPGPWIFKDPRFCLTLDEWPFWVLDPVVLFYITRPTERLKKSFKKRKQMTGGVPGESGHSVEAWVKHAQRQYDLWTGPKFQIDYDDLCAAFKIWDSSRQSHKNKKFGKIGV